MLHVAYQGLFVYEAACQPFGGGQVAATVVADVDDEAATQGEVDQHVVQIAIAYGLGERPVAHIADVVVEDAITDACRYLVVGAHIASFQGVAVVLGIGLVPGPVASVVHGVGEVDVSVAQLAEHVGEHLEELCLRHLVAYAYLIFVIYVVPVEAVFVLLVVEEAVVLVQDVPQGLEVARRRVGALVGVDAGGQGGERDKEG